MERSAVKLLKVLPNYCKGGTEGQVLNLVSSLDREVFTINSACFSKTGNILSDFEKLGIDITEYPIRQLYHPTTWLQQLRFAENIRRNRYQIVHSYNFYANCFTIPAAKLAGVPVIIASIRDQGVYLTPHKKRLQKLICRLADRILVNADSIKTWLVEEGYDEPKITVIKNGIDTSRYCELNAGDSIRNEFSVPLDVPLIVMLARLVPKKGFEELIQAAARIKSAHPDARYMIVGGHTQLVNDQVVDDVVYLRHLQNLTRKLGVSDKFIFTGHRHDTHAILAAADVSVLASHSEGLSNSILESMACGKPVVATNVGGTPELIIHGTTGLLVPPKSPIALAAALRMILSDKNLASALGSQAMAVARSQYSLERLSDETSKRYFHELFKVNPSLVRLYGNQ